MSRMFKILCALGLVTLNSCGSSTKDPVHGVNPQPNQEKIAQEQKELPLNGAIKTKAASPQLFVRDANSAFDPKLIFSFSGKAEMLGLDVGTARAAYEKLKSVQNNQLLLTGSSSGSILASYFACYGFSELTIEYLQSVIDKFKKDKVPANEVMKFALISVGESPEKDLAPIREIIDEAFSDSLCYPSHIPLLIVAANMEVADQRNKFRGYYELYGFNKDLDKFVSPANLAVYSSYTKTPKYLGRSCTYFVNDLMYEIIKRVSPNERLCDIRPIKTANDIRQAIYASVSEPTYFFPTPELNFASIEQTPDIKGDPVDFEVAPRVRTYNGGYIMLSPIQDIKRANPELPVFSTGTAGVSSLANNAVKIWFGININRSIEQQRWWADVEIPYNRNEVNKTGSPKVDSETGYVKAIKCFEEKLDCRAKPTTGNDWKIESQPTFQHAYDDPSHSLKEFVQRGVKSLQ